MDIIENLIINSSKEGDLILDPFLGSGTTAVAAKALRRHYLGFEINPKYFEISQSRLEIESPSMKKIIKKIVDLF